MARRTCDASQPLPALALTLRMVRPDYGIKLSTAPVIAVWEIIWVIRGNFSMKPPGVLTLGGTMIASPGIKAIFSKFPAQ